MPVSRELIRLPPGKLMLHPLCLGAAVLLLAGVASAEPAWARPPQLRLEGRITVDWPRRDFAALPLEFTGLYAAEGYAYKLTLPEETLVVAQQYASGTFEYWHSGDHVLYSVYEAGRAELTLASLNPLSHLTWLQRYSLGKIPGYQGDIAGADQGGGHELLFCSEERPGTPFSITMCQQFAVVDGNVASRRLIQLMRNDEGTQSQDVFEARGAGPFEFGAPATMTAQLVEGPEEFRVEFTRTGASAYSGSFESAVKELSAGLARQPYGDPRVDEEMRRAGAFATQGTRGLARGEAAQLGAQGGAWSSGFLPAFLAIFGAAAILVALLIRRLGAQR